MFNEEAFSKMRVSFFMLQKTGSALLYSLCYGGKKLKYIDLNMYKV